MNTSTSAWSLRFQRLARLAVLSALAPIVVNAQQWAGVLDSQRALDWSTAGVSGGIPSRTTTCVSLNPGVTVAQINSAIASCPAGQVVLLNAGTYNLSGGIDFNGKSDVTLRGAGASQTHLVFTGSTSCFGMGAAICMRNASYLEPTAPRNSANWTGGYGKGTSALTLSSTANINVGTLLILSQANDTSDTGNVFICSAQPACSSEGPGGGGIGGSREQLEFVKVTAVNGSQVTISPPLAMPNWRADHSPRAWWLSGAPAHGIGVEDIDIGLSGVTGAAGIHLFHVVDSWVKGVKSSVAPRNHVWIWESMHVTVRDSFFYESQNHASQSYGIESMMGSYNLFENNIFRRVTAPLMTSGSSTGTVFAYNYSSDDIYTPSANWMQPSSYFHSTGSGYILHEGNQGSGLIADDVHGPSVFVTAFRNQWEGWESGKTAQTVPVNIYSLNRYFNIIGNVLGRTGYHSKYASSPGSTSNCNASIFAVGLGGNCADGGGTFPANDSLTVSSLMRWGNYDAASAASRFVASEVPSGLGAFSNPVPQSQSLPPSFYLAGKPSWWGGMPWPAVGPDVNNGDVAGKAGHAWRNPARVCYDTAAKDANGAMSSFDPRNCYGTQPGSPTLPSPQNLRLL